MKRFLLVAAVLLSTFSLCAQSIEKYYVSRQVDNGLLFFIWEQKGFSNEGGEMYYDQTLIDQSDSIRLGITCKIRSAVRVDSMFVCRGAEVRGFAYDRHYLDPKGKFYSYRGFVKLPRVVMEQMYADSNPPVFRFTGDGQMFEFRIKPKQWEKMRQLNARIYALLRLQ